MKKGQEYLQKVIIALVVGILLFWIGFKAYAGSGSVADREVCRISAQGKSMTKLFGRGEGFLFKDLECETHNLQIKENGIYRDGKKIQDLAINNLDQGNNRKIAQDLIIKRVGDELYDCWYQFKGTDIFGQYDVNWGQRVRCVPCARITFDDGVKSKIQVLPKLYEHLSEVKDRQDIDYLTFISDGRIGESVDDIDIETKESYSIVLVAVKDELSLGKYLQRSFLFTPGLGLASVLYDLVRNQDPTVYFVDILKRQDEAELCDQFY